MSEGAPADLKLERRANGSHCLSGSLGFDTAEEAVRLMETAPPPAEGEHRLNLSGLNSVDSAGLAVILEYWRRCRLAGTRLVLEEPPEQLQRLIRISGLEAVLESP